MEQQIQNAVNWIKGQEIDGCLTGSCLLGYFEGQDIDIFTYNEAAFTKLLYSMYHNPLFLLIEPIEKWKFKDWTESSYKGSLKKLGLVTIKFKYNMCVDVNIIYKEKNHSIFDVLSNFDLDIICVGYDLKTKKTLDLSEHLPDKTATWNKWNRAFYNPNIWNLGRVLRQFERVVKYYKRGYNTDLLALKYKSILTEMLEYENIFSSEKMDEKVALVKKNSEILIKILDKWLETHILTDTESDLLKQAIRDL